MAGSRQRTSFPVRISSESSNVFSIQFERSRYWDWASPETQTLGLPPVLYTDKVPVKVPGQVQPVLVDNPITYFPLTMIPSDFADEQDGEVPSRT